MDKQELLNRLEEIRNWVLADRYSHAEWCLDELIKDVERE